MPPRNQKPDLEPHDSLFKKTFGEIPRARAELSAVLPPALLAALDLDRLELVDGSFVDEGLRKSAADLLFTARLAGRKTLVYLLFEHKSRADRWVGLQVLRYLVRIWEKYRRKYRQAKTLPPIVPVVMQHSESGWKCATSFQALFDPAVRAIPELRRLLPDFEFLLDDISHASDADLRARKLDPFGALVLWALRDARRKGRVSASVAAWRGEVRKLLRRRGGREALKPLLSYIVNVAQEPFGDAFAKAVGDAAPESKDTLMTTLAQRWLAEGREQQARRILRKLLKLRFGNLDDATVARVERGTEKELDRWAERVVTASSLSEVFEQAGRGRRRKVAAVAPVPARVGGARSKTRGRGKSR
jgi:hypothetical protein